MIFTYLRFKSDHPIPPPGASGAGDVASLLVTGLREKGFNPSDPQDQEFAHFVRCKSGQYDYEIMVAFDFSDGSTWEISCRKKLGALQRLFGKTEDAELSALVEAIDRVVKTDSHTREMHWYPAYGDTSPESGHPVTGG